MNYPIWRILIIMLFLVWPYAKLSAALPILNVPVRVYIISDMQMSKQGQDLSSWISESDFSREVLPEVNRIWKPARIVFSLESVQKAPALDHKNKAKIINYVENAKRDSKGKSDGKRIKKLEKLMVNNHLYQNGITVFVVPYLGEKSQGNASRQKQRLFIGQWTDKYRKGKTPEKFQLIEYGEFKKGSFSRTLAHEIGHILGLKHPDTKFQVYFNRLMGGKNPGIQMISEEIDRARGVAEKLVH